MLETQGDYDSIDNNTIPLYNPGVKESDFILTLRFPSGNYIPGGTIRLNGSTFLTISQINRQGEDDYIKIDTKLGLIYGCKRDGIKTGKIYNQNISDGDFFKIPCNSSQDGSLSMTVDNNIAEHFVEIDYDYYYY